jgi:hypothetical protein
MSIQIGNLVVDVVAMTFIQFCVDFFYYDLILFQFSIERNKCIFTFFFKLLVRVKQKRKIYTKQKSQAILFITSFYFFNVLSYFFFQFNLKVEKKLFTKLIGSIKCYTTADKNYRF